MSDRLPALLGEIGALPEPTGWDNFWYILSKPDNVPIILMIGLFSFFIYFSLKMGRENDKLIDEGRRDEILRKMQE